MGTPATGSAAKPFPTVLLVDTDLGFTFWLGRALDNAGFEALPAKSIWDGMALIDEYQLSVDVLVLNPELPGADRLVTFLRHSRDVKVIATNSNVASGFPEVDAVLPRPRDFDDERKAEWLRLIQTLLWG